MYILKKGHQPGVYVPLRALFLVLFMIQNLEIFCKMKEIMPENDNVKMHNHVK